MAKDFASWKTATSFSSGLIASQIVWRSSIRSSCKFFRWSNENLVRDFFNTVRWWSFCWWKGQVRHLMILWKKNMRISSSSRTFPGLRCGNRGWYASNTWGPSTFVCICWFGLSTQWWLGAQCHFHASRNSDFSSFFKLYFKRVGLDILKIWLLQLTHQLQKAKSCWYWWIIH